MLTKMQKYPLLHGSGYFVFCRIVAFFQFSASFPYFRLSATATATATVAPTIGLLPIEIRRFIRQKTIVLFCFFLSSKAFRIYQFLFSSQHFL